MKKKRQLVHSPLEETILKGANEGGSVSIPRGIKGLVLNLAFAVWCLAFVFFLSPLFAEGSGKSLNDLTSQILETKSSSERYSLFEQVTDIYFKENKYNEYVEYLKSLSTKNSGLEPIVNYYIALCRYYQLKYLEESQNWDEYFNNGNIYREQIIESAKKAIDKTLTQEPINIYAKLILWRLHKDQEDNLTESSLSDLMASVLEYSKEPLNIMLIKDVADQLSSYGEKLQSRQLYKIYVDKIAVSEVNPESLESVAAGFYKEGNLELAELVYDIYIERSEKSLSKEKLMPVLVNISKQFSCQSLGAKDLFFAEKVFKKIEEKNGKDVFDEELLYLRAFNLEKAKDYKQAKDRYVDLISLYPESLHFDEANYKLGIIFTYVLRDVKTGKEYFQKLADKILSVDSAQNESSETPIEKRIPSPEAISSLYQLGLLSQWSNALPEARQYYDKLLETAKDGFVDKVNLVKQRLKEIDETKPIESNLRMFLDLSIKDENSIFDMTKIDLKVSLYYVKSDQTVSVSAIASPPESGCMQVKLEYLWSGNLGSVTPNLNEASFDTVYSEPGTKEINLVVVSSTGILDRSIEIVNVYPPS